MRTTPGIENACDHSQGRADGTVFSSNCRSFTALHSRVGTDPHPELKSFCFQTESCCMQRSVAPLSCATRTKIMPARRGLGRHRTRCRNDLFFQIESGAGRLQPFPWACPFCELPIVRRASSWTISRLVQD